MIDLEKEVALGVDSGSAHENNVESETDMAEHENVKVGEGTGACSGNLSHLSPIVLPARKKLREECYASMAKQASKMQRRMEIQAGADLLDVGTIVLLEATEV